jgi:glycosyltransferase involved in cell wall biosynthesis
VAERPVVTVVIPVRDDPRVSRAVEAVLAQEGAPAFEVIVVDNGSSPGFRKQLDALPGSVRLLDEPRRGAGAARNRALDAASGRFVFFTDADAVVAKDWIREGLAGFAATGVDLLQGSWRERGATRVERLAAGLSSRLQAAPLHPGTCDTKNLAVRREVLERVRFDPEFLRDQDTVSGSKRRPPGFVSRDGMR